MAGSLGDRGQLNEWLMVHLNFKIKSGGVYPVTPAIDTKSTLPLKGGLGLEKRVCFLKGAKLQYQTQLID